MRHSSLLIRRNEVFEHMIKLEWLLRKTRHDEYLHTMIVDTLHCHFATLVDLWDLEVRCFRWLPTPDSDEAVLPELPYIPNVESPHQDEVHPAAMREITDHKISALNKAIEIKVKDEPGPGGASHQYEILLLETGPAQPFRRWELDFQNGPIEEAGFNGLTNESLIAIVIDRLRSFQDGPFACAENDIALMHIETGLLWLHKRTLDRMKRGVDGKLEK